MQPNEEKLIRLKEQRSKQAIALAMDGRWEEAIEVNKGIVEYFPKDVDAYNRLGRAYMELGEYPQAKEAYSRTIKLDPYNAIARKNLQRLSHLKDAAAVAGSHESRGVAPQHFIEEIGRAGVVSLHSLASKAVLASIVAGDSVNLRIEGSSLIAESQRGEYLGQVDARHALRLVKLMEGGNKYAAAVVSVTVGSMTIMIREVYQAPSQAGRLSFPPRGLEEVRPYVSDRLLKAESELEDEAARESGYTIIGGEEIEVLPDETADIDEDFIGEED